MMSDAVLILFIDPETLNPRWLNLLKQEIQALPEIKEKEIELTHDLQEIVDFINDQNNVNQIVSFKDVAKRFNITRSTARKRINSLQYTGLLDIKKKGRYKMLEVREG
jgi:predicted transcriptional regulator